MVKVKAVEIWLFTVTMSMRRRVDEKLKLTLIRFVYMVAIRALITTPSNNELIIM